ncbi:MAG: ABC transporter ATP-binding protein [Rubricoccaceae bacterium]
MPRRLLRRLGAVLWPYRYGVGLALALTLGSAFLGPLRPYLIQRAVDDAIVQGDAPGLLRIVALIGGALLLEGVFAFALGYLTQWVGQHALFDLRTRVFRHLERQRLAFFDRTPIGRLITRATSDIEALADLLSASLVTMLGDLARILFIAGFMLWYSVELALVALTTLPLMIGATEYFRRKMREAYRETRKQVARLNAFLQEHLTGMSVVQIFGREAEEQRRFEAINDDHRRAHIRTIFYFALFWPVVDVIAGLALGLVLWYGGSQAMRDALDVGVLIAFTLYVRMFFEPVRNLSDQFNTLQSALAAGERIFDLLDDDQALPSPAAPVALGRPRGHIAFENVWFAYDTAAPRAEAPGGDGAPAARDEASEPDWVLRDVSFEVLPGQTLALVGATGSGKTTIISLLLRFYDVQRGRILIDGHDIRSLDVATLRAHVGLVLQDVFLFSGTLAENVTLGNPAVSREAVERALALVGADGFVGRLPGGLEYVVGERGATLSLGQRQLLSLVRALLYDPAILVLDEATSSVDTETEALVQHALDVLRKGRTALVVAHRLSTVQHAEQILVLHRGAIRERGTHQELLARGGLYRRLYELQYAAQEQRAA